MAMGSGIIKSRIFIPHPWQVGVAGRKIVEADSTTVYIEFALFGNRKRSVASGGAGFLCEQFTIGFCPVSGGAETNCQQARWGTWLHSGSSAR
jgi:hypothetical protein